MQDINDGRFKFATELKTFVALAGPLSMLATTLAGLVCFFAPGRTFYVLCNVRHWRMCSRGLCARGIVVVLLLSILLVIVAAVTITTLFSIGAVMVRV